MMNPIPYALNQVYFRVPRELLQQTFMRNLPPYSRMSLDQKIIEDIINSRVIVDCGMFGGKIKYIVLRWDMHERVEYGLSESQMYMGSFGLYRIPPEERENQPISFAISISYPGRAIGPPSSQTGIPAGSTIGVAAHDMLESHTLSNTPTMPTPELLGPDLVRLNPSQHTHIDWVLTCRLSYDESMTNLARSAVTRFANMVVYATQAHIYNTLVVEMDRAFVVGGAELGAVSGIIESYSEANTLYQEELTRFKGANKLDARTKMIMLSHMM